jgi:itaconate CoA-transferase
MSWTCRAPTSVDERLLDGLLVVALEQAVAAPLATCRLADAGARVIKIERPEGDFARDYDHAAGSVSSYFAWLNRGKESVVLDLKQGPDFALLKRILARADVFVHNLSPGAVDRLGLEDAVLRAANRRLINCDIRAYGDNGPSADRKGYDLLIQAETGLASVTGSPAEPGRVGISVADISAGTALYSRVLEALLRRVVTNEGLATSVSLFDALAEWMAVPLLQYRSSGRPPARIGLAHVSIAPYGVFRCKDSEIVVAVQNQREWRVFCADVLHRPDLESDRAFIDNSARTANRQALDAIIKAEFGRLTRSQLSARLNSARIAYGSVNTVADLDKHPHLRDVRVPVPGDNAVHMPPPPGAGHSWKPGAVPALGAHTDAVRAEFA